MITTIQIHEKVKSELKLIKKPKETFEDVIVRLIDSKEEQKRKQEKLMIEGCKEMAKDMLEINKEWEGALMDGLNKDERW